MENLSRKSTYAVFKTLDNPISEEGKWAVNALRTVKALSYSRDQNSFYDEVIDSLSAVTFYTVARAETGGEVGAQQYDFHHSIVTDIREDAVKSSAIDQIQEKLQDHDDKLELTDDHLGKIDRRGKSLEGRVRQIEEELDDCRSKQHELFQDVVDNSERLDIVYDDIVDTNHDLRSLEARYEELENNLKEIRHMSKGEDDETTGLLRRIENWISRRKSTEGRQTEIDDWV